MRRRPTATSYDDDDLDVVVSTSARPVDERPPLLDRLADLVSRLTGTPRAASAATAWVFAVIVMVVSWANQSTASARTAIGTVRVSCGIDVFVYGYPDHAVASACRNAEAWHFALFLPSALVVLAGLVVCAVVGWRMRVEASPQRSVPRLLAEPAGRVLVIVAALSALIGAAMLRPVPVRLLRDGGLSTVRCGADTWFFGHSDPVVHRACSAAYSTQGHVLTAALVLLALALAGIVRLFWSWSGRQGRVKVVAVVASAGLLLVALLALTPVTVNVTGGATPVTAVCGFDTYLAGNPDRSVERECRAHYTSRVELAAALGVAAMVVAAAGLVAGRRRADGPPGPRAVVVA